MCGIIWRKLLPGCNSYLLQFDDASIIAADYNFSMYTLNGYHIPNATVRACNNRKVLSFFPVLQSLCRVFINTPICPQLR